jgi:Outer membrane protein (OmpH-like)
MRNCRSVLALVVGLWAVSLSPVAAQQSTPASAQGQSIRLAYIEGPLMTADSRRDKQEAFERKRRDAARMMDDYQKELEKKEQALLQRVLQELSGVIEKVGKDRGYYMIVEKRGASVLYASPDADLTDEIIRAYDTQAPAKKTP